MRCRKMRLSVGSAISSVVKATDILQFESFQQRPLIMNTGLFYYDGRFPSLYTGYSAKYIQAIILSRTTFGS